MSEYGGTPPAGWYPETDGWERFWDGTAWTSDRRPAGAGAPAPPPPAEPTRFAGPAATGPVGGPPTSPPPGGYGSGPYAAPYQPPEAAPGAGSPYGAPDAYRPPDYRLPDVGGGFPAPGYPPPQRPRSLLWLWVTLAVVLVLIVGAGVTLAVTQPWSGETSTTADDASADGEAGGDEGGDDGGDGGAEAGSQGLAAHSDFDGDGNGDVAGTYYNDRSTALVTLTSDGSGFAVDEAPGSSAGVIWDDWDGDGTAAALSWRYRSYDDELEIEGVIGDFDDDTWGGFGLWEDAEYWLRLDSGDFDGDGAVDLVVVGQTGQRTVTIWVMRGTGDSFDNPEEWSVVKGATFGSTQVFPGDHDGDGVDDLVALLPTDASSIPKDDLDSSLVATELGTTLLSSTGDGFDRGDLGASPFDDETRMQRAYAVGDFRGDGTPLIAMQSPDYSSRDVVFLEYADGDLVVADLTADLTGYLRGVTAADVDGDGRDDLVTVRGNDDDSSEISALLVETFLATGDGMESAGEWAELECDDSCTLVFDAPTGY